MGLTSTAKKDPFPSPLQVGGMLNPLVVLCIVLCKGEKGELTYQSAHTAQDITHLSLAKVQDPPTCCTFICQSVGAPASAE